MSNKIIAGSLIVVAIITCGVVWSMRSSNNNVHPSSVAANSQSQPANQGLVVYSTEQTVKGKAFHFYSPLHDSPPIPTPEQLQHWQAALHTTLLNEIKPVLSGPPLASAYADEASKASKGDVQAAKMLFEGLVYCQEDTRGSLDTKQKLDTTIEHMRDTHSDRDGVHTDNLTSAISDLQKQYQYCAGLTAEVENMDTIGHWAEIAAQSNDPITLAWSAESLTPSKQMNSTTLVRSQDKFREMVNSAAQAGVPKAWFYIWAGYKNGAGGYPVDPVRAYASLYTEYMLTKSPYLAYQIWQQSLQLSPQQIQEGEVLATQNYQSIKSNI